MDDFQHPLSTPPLRVSPAPVEEETRDRTTSLKSHKDNSSQATNRFEQQQVESRILRGRSKSVALGTYAWTLNSPRPPIDFVAPVTGSGVPYKARSWEPTLEKAIRAIVSIKASHVRSFDTETSGKKKKRPVKQKN
jgi:hypothetical protein